MAQAKRKTEWQAEANAAAIPAERIAAAPSPARALQQMLEERTALVGDVERWSGRRALAFIVTSAAALWLAILVAVHGAMTLIA